MLETRGTAKAFGDFLDGNVYKIGYLIGTRGQTCTQSMIDYRLASESYKSYWYMIGKYANKWLANNPYDGGPWVVADCMGWLEMFWNGGWYDRPLTSRTMQYNDTNTGLMYKLAQIEGLPNGPISTLPKDNPYPIAVCYTGHVGFYYKGLVYQSAGHKVGAIRSTLTNTDNNRVWTNWYMIPHLDYAEGGDTVLQRGSKGAAVRGWQIRLMQWNVNALPRFKADSDFGGETEDWTNRFKASVSMEQNGIVDDLTWDAMVEVLKGDQAELELVRAQLAAEQGKTASLTDRLASADATSARLTAERQKMADALHTLKSFVTI